MKLYGGTNEPMNPGEHIYWNLTGYNPIDADKFEPTYVETIISDLNSLEWKLKYPLNVEVQFLENNVVVVSSLNLGIVVSASSFDYAIDLFRDRADTLIGLLNDGDCNEISEEWLGDINQIVQPNHK